MIERTHLSWSTNTLYHIKWNTSHKHVTVSNTCSVVASKFSPLRALISTRNHITLHPLKPRFTTASRGNLNTRDVRAQAKNQAHLTTATVSEPLIWLSTRIQRSQGRVEELLPSKTGPSLTARVLLACVVILLRSGSASTNAVGVEALRSRMPGGFMRIYTWVAVSPGFCLLFVLVSVFMVCV